MVTPNQRRRVVGHVDRNDSGSPNAGRAGWSVRPVPPNGSRRPFPEDEEEQLRAWLRDFAKRRPRWGWRRAPSGSGGRLESEQEAGPASVARRGAAGRAPQAQEAAPRQGSRRCVLSDPTERLVGARLPVRPDRRRPNPEAVERDRRIHPRVPGDRRGPQHRRRQSRRHPRPDRRRARRTRLHPLRQRSRAHRLAGRGLVPVQHDRRPCSSNQDHRGRTHGSRASTAGSATSSSTASSSTTCSKPSVVIEDWRIDYNMNRRHTTR